MGILTVLEQFSDRSGSGTYKAEREYVRVFKVITDSLIDDAITISAAAGIPRIFDRYVGSDGQVDPLGALCTKVEPRCVGEFEWIVRCYYSNRCDWPQFGNPNPLARPSEVSWSFVEATRVATRDLNGKAYMNSAGQKFKPGREVDDSRLQLTIKRTQASYDPNLAAAYHGAVNSDTFYGLPPGYVKASISGQNHYENDVMYQEVTYVFQIKNPAREGWQPLILDEGYSFINPNTGKLTNFLDEHGSPVGQQLLLDGQGGPLADNAGITGAHAAVNALGLSNNAGQITFPGSDPKWVSGASFPITVLIDSEQITLTGAKVGAAYKITRGVNGTTAQNHAAGATIQLQPVFLTFVEHPPLPFAALNVP